MNIAQEVFLLGIIMWDVFHWLSTIPWLKVFQQAAKIEHFKTAFTWHLSKVYHVSQLIAVAKSPSDALTVILIGCTYPGSDTGYMNGTFKNQETAAGKSMSRVGPSLQASV